MEGSNEDEKYYLEKYSTENDLDQYLEENGYKHLFKIMQAVGIWFSNEGILLRKPDLDCHNQWIFYPLFALTFFSIPARSWRALLLQRFCVVSFFKLIIIETCSFFIMCL